MRGTPFVTQVKLLLLKSEKRVIVGLGTGNTNTTEGSNQKKDHIV